MELLVDIDDEAVASSFLGEKGLKFIEKFRVTPPNTLCVVSVS